MGEGPGIVANLVVQAAVGLVLLALFESCRRLAPLYLRSARRKGVRRPPDAPFAWVAAVLSVSEEDTLRIAGVDGYVLLRYLRACLHVLTVAAVLGVVVLVPVYMEGGEELDGLDATTVSNLKNEAKALWAPLVMGYVFTLYALYVFRREYEYFYYLRQLYLRHGDPDVPKQVYYTIMVERIPPYLRTDRALAEWFESMFPGQVYGAVMCIPSRKLLGLYRERAEAIDQLEHQIASEQATGERPQVREKWCGEKVDGIELYRQKLDELNEEILGLQRDIFARLRKLEDEGLAGKKPTFFFDKVLDFARSNLYWPPFPKGDSLAEDKSDLVNVPEDQADAILEQHSSPTKAFAEVELGDDVPQEEEALDEHSPIAKAQEVRQRSSDYRGAKDALTGELWLSGTGFVSFKSQLACVEATQLKLSEDTLTLLITPNPDPLDVIWQNVAAPTDRAATMRFGMDILFGFGILFWAAVLAFIAAIAQPQQIAEVIPPFEDLEGTIVWDLFAGPIPVYLLMIFIAMVPTIIRSVAISVEQQKSRMAVEQYVLEWFFGYQLANVLINIIAASLWDVLADALDDPSSVFDLLAEALPASAAFFLNFVVAQALVSNPLGLLNIGGLVMYWFNYLFRKAKAITRRELYNGIFADQDIAYGDELPNIVLIVLIGLVYWTIAPLVLLPCVAFFAFAYVVYKYRLLYVVSTRPQTGGQFWYSTYRHAMIGLVVSSLVLVAFLGLKRSPIGAPLVLPLPIFTMYHWFATERMYREPSQRITRKKAVLNDQMRTDAVSADFDMERYRQPFLVPQPEEPEPYIPMCDERGKLDTSDQHYRPRDVQV